MEWTDTMMLDSAPAHSLHESGSAVVFTRLVTLQGVSLLCANATSRDEMASALELLRGFRATGRRVVLCDTSSFVAGKQFGREVVEGGAANVLVSCGISGREVGIGARDAGLDLASVVVCGNPLAGGKVLANLLVPGDTVLLIGVEHQACDDVITLLDNRLSQKTVVAA